MQFDELAEAIELHGDGGSFSCPVQQGFAGPDGVGLFSFRSPESDGSMIRSGEVQWSCDETAKKSGIVRCGKICNDGVVMHMQGHGLPDLGTLDADLVVDVHDADGRLEEDKIRLHFGDRAGE